MTIKIYNKTNFHKYTFCIFTEVAADAIKELKLNFKSKSGSSYYFVENGVYRLSNHWGRAANCKWRLLSNTKNVNRMKLGFASWNDFYPDNDYEKLYFIEVNHSNQSVNFYHKQSENYSSNKVLRTSNETTKLIKQIRNLVDETAWVKHLKSDNVEELRKQIIDRLINSNQSFQEIRRDFL
ncbi:hypothetical protein [Flavobacterium sp.]|uniref:hypothetical protein n=1 Tax=Flavobacterium sp. TaxID=239 RepID=UPI00374FDBC8